LPAAPASDLRRAFGNRLRRLRATLAYTQSQMARALGIETARYSKYEIGRSEAPYDVLIKIAHLAETSLDYLITGRLPEHAPAHGGSRTALREFVEALPLATVIYDAGNRLYGCNRAFQELFFAHAPDIIRPGTPRELLLRSWAYSQGHDPVETEAFVRERLEHRPVSAAPVEVLLGNQVLRIAESRHEDLKLVLVTDLTSRD
jgi:transcriptional regulator with XRE-family HTH domain